MVHQICVWGFKQESPQKEQPPQQDPDASKIAETPSLGTSSSAELPAPEDGGVDLDVEVGRFNITCMFKNLSTHQLATKALTARFQVLHARSNIGFYYYCIPKNND